MWASFVKEGSISLLKKEFAGGESSILGKGISSKCSSRSGVICHVKEVGFSFGHLFIQHEFIECLLFARHCARL